MVYVLELEGGFYYVGSTKNLKRRLGQHFSGKGSEWTQRHPPIKCLGAVRGFEQEEYKVTLFCMKYFGWWKVRGSKWTKKFIHKPKQLGKTTYKAAQQFIAGLGQDQ